MISYPDCNFPIQDIQQSISRIMAASQKKLPISFVRIGDGEGHLLSLCEKSTIEDIYYFNSHFGASRITYQRLISLRDELREACENADIIGLRDDILNVSVDDGWFSLPPWELEQKVKKKFSLRPVEKSLNPFGCRRLALTNQSISRLQFQLSAVFTSAWGHWDLLLSGYLYHLMMQQKHIGIITSRSALPKLIEQFFPLTVSFYYVPDSFGNQPPIPAGEHFPRRFENLRDELSVKFQGMLFLVGAGICGKVYCQWIKERGGIAIDIGSVMDTWLGLGSRPAVLADRFGYVPAHDQIPEDLLLNRSSINRLMARVDGAFISLANQYGKAVQDVL